MPLHRAEVTEARMRCLECVWGAGGRVERRRACCGQPLHSARDPSAAAHETSAALKQTNALVHIPTSRVYYFAARRIAADIRWARDAVGVFFPAGLLDPSTPLETLDMSLLCRKSLCAVRSFGGRDPSAPARNPVLSPALAAVGVPETPPTEAPAPSDCARPPP